MRKCPYCAMISQADDVCPWCKRPFEAFVFPTAPKKQTGRKKPSRQMLIGRGVAMVAVIAVAIWSLAQQRTTPDAARIVEASSGPQARAAAPAPMPQGSTVMNSGTQDKYQQPTYHPVFTQNVTPQSAVSAQSSSSGVSDQTQTGPAVAKIAAINISTSNDQQGSETALGTVTIVNQSAYEITDFQLTLQVNNNPATLVPFDGDISYPMPLSSMRIPAHGRLQVQVGTPNRYPAANIGARRVELTAHFANGSTATDSATLHA